MHRARRLCAALSNRPIRSHAGPPAPRLNPGRRRGRPGVVATRGEGLTVGPGLGSPSRVRRAGAGHPPRGGSRAGGLRAAQTGPGLWLEAEGSPALRPGCSEDGAARKPPAAHPRAGNFVVRGVQASLGPAPLGAASRRVSGHLLGGLCRPPAPRRGRAARFAVGGEPGLGADTCSLLASSSLQ